MTPRREVARAREHERTAGVIRRAAAAAFAACADGGGFTSTRRLRDTLRALGALSLLAPRHPAVVATCHGLLCRQAGEDVRVLGFIADEWGPRLLLHLCHYLDELGWEYDAGRWRAPGQPGQPRHPGQPARPARRRAQRR